MTGATRRMAVPLGLALTLLFAVACGEDPAADVEEDVAEEEPADDDPADEEPADEEPAEEEPAEDGDGTLRVYTTVTQDTVDALVEDFEAAHEVEFAVFRAPTGEFNARVAAERREGEIQADVFWLTDPLSMQPFEADDLLHEWTPAGADHVPEEYQEETFWGTRLLNLVIVAHEGLDPAPRSWWDLAELDGEEVGLPDPGFAGSAFGALGFFALDGEHGFEFFEALADSGVTQVDAPGEVVTGVAEGRFGAGVTLDRNAREAVEDGSPVQLIWPEPGAIAVYSPIAVLGDAPTRDVAEEFVEFVLSLEGQEAVAATGWQPVHPDASWPHDAGPTVAPDWGAAFERHDELLEEYRAFVGG